MILKWVTYDSDAWDNPILPEAPCTAQAMRNFCPRRHSNCSHLKHSLSKKRHIWNLTEAHALDSCMTSYTNFSWIYKLNSFVPAQQSWIDFSVKELNLESQGKHVRLVAARLASTGYAHLADYCLATACMITTGPRAIPPKVQRSTTQATLKNIGVWRL